MSLAALDTAFADPLGGADPVTWDRLAADHLYSSSGWLRFCAADPGGRATAGALRVPLPGGGEAATAVTAVESEANLFYDWDRQLADRGLPTLGAGGLLAGQRRGYRSTLLVAAGADRHRGATAILEALRDLRERLPLERRPAGTHWPCVAVFLDTADVLALRGAGVPATPVAVAAEAWIPVDAPDWDSWLAALPSPRRADIVRRDVRRFRDAGYELVETTLSAFIDDAARLQASTQARYGHPAEAAALAASFRVQAAAMGNAGRVVAARMPGEPPVGFCLYYLCGATLYLRTAGFDYARLRGAAEYFNTVYYAPVRSAIGAGCRWVHAGIEAAEAKALRGARIRPLWLLDLDADSVLVAHEPAIRAHNAAMHGTLAASSRAVARALCPQDWSPFW